MNIALILAQCAQGGQGGEGQQGDLITSLLVPMAMIGLVFYFVLIRPQRKREKERQEMISDVKKNDKIVTNGGIFGTVVTSKDNWVIIRIDDNSDTRMKILRSTIAGPADSFDKKEEEKDPGKKDKNQDRDKDKDTKEEGSKK